ncbi:lactate utilization protein [Rhodospirillaceae bacterium SYSU D60014]|uniref:LutC/YkgG family protein n=1 Tax=Virgifigura deserti TaxID=2268457 RepID=UPI000E664F6A
MSAARQQILDALRRSLRRDVLPEADRVALEARLAAPKPGLIPARSRSDGRARVAQFLKMAEEAAATVTHLPSLRDVPGAVTDYLARENLPAALRLAPDPRLQSLPWAGRPLLSISTGRSDGSDPVSLTPAFAGIAETGTLVLLSGAETPTTLNFLPDTHIVLLEAGDIVGAYENVWPLLRARFGAAAMPRTVNLITGPSRSADIEQTLQMGAHGPRRLHILLVDEQEATR